MKTNFYLGVLLFVAAFSGNISAQSEIRIKEWGKPHGIESTIIFGVFQDKNHLIWLCTYNGLYYFDGFRAYKSQILDADGKTSIEGIVNQLVQSADGRYWLKVGDTLGAYDIYSKIFNPLNTQPSDHLATFNSIGNHLFVREIEKTLLVDQKAMELIPMVFVDEKGETLSDIIIASGSTGKYFSFKDNFPVEVLPTDIPGKYYENKTGDPSTVYWNEKGYFKYNIDSHGNTWYMHPFHWDWLVEDSLGRDVTEDLLRPFQGVKILYLLTQPGYSWFFTDKGLVLWEKDNSSPRYLFDEFPEVLSTINFNVFDLGKTVWTWNRQGIANIKVNHSNFSSITKDQDGLYSNFILGIYPFDDSKHLIKHDFSDRYHSFYHINAKKITKISKEELFQKSVLEEYEEMHRESDQKEWIVKHGTHIHNYAHIIPNRNPFTRLFISDGNEYDYAIVPANNVKRGFQLWRISTDTLVFPKIDPLQFADQGDTVWIGTESVGLIALHTPTGETAQWLPDPINPSDIPAHRVHVVIPAADGNLWLGTGKGLSYFNKKTGLFTTLNTKDGLIDDRISCMAFDRNGFLWIGTVNGLSRFDPRTKTFANFTVADGLVNGRFHRISAVLLEDGRMMFGGMDGIDLFDPDKVVDQMEKPTPLIAHIHNNNRLINLKSQLNFNSDENHFSFYISANPIWMASTLTYQYRLDGAEEDWQSLNFTNTVHYPNLPPGNYRFEVNIANQPEIASYSFTIHPVWYRTWWFKVSYILSGLFVGYLF